MGKALFPPKEGKEIILMYRGNDLKEDLKTLKELGITPEQPPTFFITLRTINEL